eukprot:gnl/Spiro4/3716_TR1816_c0_g1_i1.p1 gnl/Spiro4/3716_TR1816_c0_g1~~gnl/Spiro4/3716_TR1816_c0_g1_i1.p1  ORF type:complete len:597 (-),score=201.89 gnl/Spiro4/3716_TR1816_c0_g1_i1:84-1838(-)
MCPGFRLSFSTSEMALLVGLAVVLSPIWVPVAIVGGIGVAAKNTGTAVGASMKNSVKKWKASQLAKAQLRELKRRVVELERRCAAAASVDLGLLVQTAASHIILENYFAAEDYARQAHLVCTHELAVGTGGYLATQRLTELLPKVLYMRAVTACALEKYDEAIELLTDAIDRLEATLGWQQRFAVAELLQRLPEYSGISEPLYLVPPETLKSLPGNGVFLWDLYNLRGTCLQQRALYSHPQGSPQSRDDLHQSVADFDMAIEVVMHSAADYDEKLRDEDCCVNKQVRAFMFAMQPIRNRLMSEYFAALLHTTDDDRAVALVAAMRRVGYGHVAAFVNRVHNCSQGDGANPAHDLLRGCMADIFALVRQATAVVHGLGGCDARSASAAGLHALDEAYESVSQLRECNSTFYHYAANCGLSGQTHADMLAELARSMDGNAFVVDLEEDQLTAPWPRLAPRLKTRVSSLPHDFEAHYFATPSWCDHCHKFLKGVTRRQGFICRRCKFQAHDACRNSVKMCRVAEHSESHDFQETHFSTPTWCGTCRDFIYGLFGKQGLRCSNCKLSIHRRCREVSTAPCASAVSTTH